MNKLKKYALLTQMKTWTAISTDINILLISYITFGFNGFAVGLLCIPLTRFIEEKMGYSYYQEEFTKINNDLKSPEGEE